MPNYIVETWKNGQVIFNGEFETAGQAQQAGQHQANRYDALSYVIRTADSKMIDVLSKDDDTPAFDITPAQALVRVEQEIAGMTYPFQGDPMRLISTRWGNFEAHFTSGDHVCVRNPNQQPITINGKSFSASLHFYRQTWDSPWFAHAWESGRYKREHLWVERQGAHQPCTDRQLKTLTEAILEHLNAMHRQNPALVRQAEMAKIYRDLGGLQKKLREALQTLQEGFTEKEKLERRLAELQAEGEEWITEQGPANTVECLASLTPRKE